MKKLKDIIIGIMLSFLSLCMTLMILELIFRLADIRGTYMRPRIDHMAKPPTSKALSYSFYPYGIIRSVYPSNPRGYFDENISIDHKFNSAGWRDEEHSLIKPSRTYRILGLGDSYLYGQGVRDKDICLSKLGIYLTATNKSVTKIETINTGMSSYNTADERNLLIKRGVFYKPDLVIVHFVLNDVEQNLDKQEPQIEFFTNYLALFMKSDTMSNYSYLWSWIRQRYLQHVKGDAYIRQCLNSYLTDRSKIDFVRNALRDIHVICNEHHARLLVVIFPFYYHLDSDYPFQPIHDDVRKFCEREGIPVLDLKPYYRNYKGPELWVHPVDQHPNEIAHDIAAKAICDFLLRNRSYFRLSFLQN